ncbi:MAG: family 10 glycosylhydrolase [Akkermansiaceae bacterium]|nr:family 10 glycosylhydrolase [Akkermansiaceae bacterium]
MLLVPGTSALGQKLVPIQDDPGPLPREFRAAWIATAYNIDWPSKQGLTAAQQQAELRRMLDAIASLKMNAVIFQVRPMGDAFYKSSLEPWSHFLTGQMGRSPGYDPLEFCIREAHARGLEVHAWFNPFRALCNNDIQASRDHVTRSNPGITKRYGSQTWCDPGMPESRELALKVITDVVRRYDIDGVHLDDYFYPYPKKGVRPFADGKSPAQRRAHIDDFVESLYRSVKQTKPWVRVGISPFGIWRPGVPDGIVAGLDSYEELAGDSRKWLRESWVDYLSPQLYWRIDPPDQSFPKLLEWWREQGKRPVWPGIATQRINGPEDGRKVTEIPRQIKLTRRIGRSWHGHIHWSATSLVKDQGGIRRHLEPIYTQPALVPPMPWQSRKNPDSPTVKASQGGQHTFIEWKTADKSDRVAIQARYKGRWYLMRVAAAAGSEIRIPRAEAIALSAVDRYGNTSSPTVLGKP